MREKEWRDEQRDVDQVEDCSTKQEQNNIVGLYIC